ncbi:MAG: alpha/beta hydrolase [Bacillota bacterium]
MFKKIFILLIIFSLAFTFKTAAEERAISFRSEETVNLEAEKLTYHLGTRTPNKLNKNLFIALEGAARRPYTNLEIWENYLPPNTDLLLIEKYAFKDPELFAQTNNINRRIKDAKFLINYVLDSVYHNDLKNIILAGRLEGGKIAPQIAAEIPEITHLISLSAGGYSLEKELKILLAKKIKDPVNEGKFFNRVKIDTQKKLAAKFDIIREYPVPDAKWLNLTYKHFASLLDYESEPYLRNLEIPVLYVIGAKSQLTPPEGVEYLADKFGEKDNFTFKIMPRLNYRFIDEKGENQQLKSVKRVINDWYQKNKI